MDIDNEEDLIIYKNGDKKHGEASFYFGDFKQLSPLGKDHFRWNLNKEKDINGGNYFTLDLKTLGKQIEEISKRGYGHSGRPFEFSVITLFVVYSDEGTIYQYKKKCGWEKVGTIKISQP